MTGLEEKLSGSFCTEVNGWLRVHVEGEPERRGFQHGYYLADGIALFRDILNLLFQKSYGVDWKRMREDATKLFLDRVPEELLDEIKGIAEGAEARGVDVDYVDVLTLNSYGDLYSYYTWLREEGRLKGSSNPAPAFPASCSAFIATGSYTADGGIVLAHNMWWYYINGYLYNVVMSLKPTDGNTLMFQTFPGAICGCTLDWCMNDKGIVVVETTILGAVTFNPDGVPYFVRTRMAHQYTDSVDGWVETMLRENNGGFASNWLVGDAKTGEIGHLQLATYHHKVDKTGDGYFIGCNMAFDEGIRSETNVDWSDPSGSAVARFKRAKQLIEASKGRIDFGFAEAYLSDHFDTSVGRVSPSRCTLCGHIEEDPRGMPEFDCDPYFPCGAIDGKVVTSELALRGSFWIHWGRTCGTPFIVEDFLRLHPEYEWQRPYMKDIKPYPWTLFSMKTPP